MHLYISLSTSTYSTTTEIKACNQSKINISIHLYLQEFLNSELVNHKDLGKFKALEVGEIHVSWTRSLRAPFLDQVVSELKID